MDSGADVVFGAGGKTGNGALIEVAGEAGAFCIGVDSDQWYTVPEAHPCLVTSAMKLITPGVSDLILLAAAGNAASGNSYGSVGLAPHHDLDSSVSQEIQDMIIALDAALMDGSQSTGYSFGDE
jgi:basic membrane protein A